MKDTLRVMRVCLICRVQCVLILVVMEDTLRVTLIFNQKLLSRLNPCFNGRYSQRVTAFGGWLDSESLNPCCNGRYSQRGNCC